MEIAEGDILELLVMFVSSDACWGTSGDLTGFIHHKGWSARVPVPDSAIPIVGQTIRVRVVHVVEDDDQLPAWSTFGGKFKVNFSARCVGS